MAEPDDPRNPEAWFGEPGICGSCVAWKPIETPEEEDIAIGLCRLRPELRRVPATLAKCPKYNQRGGFRYDPKRSAPKPSGRRRKAAVAVVKRRNDAGELVDVTPPTKARVSRAPKRSLPSKALMESEAFEYTAPPEPVYRPFPTPAEPRPSEVDLDGATGPLVEAALIELVREDVFGRRRDLHSKFRHGGRVVLTDAEGERRTVPAHRFQGWLERLAKTIDALEEAVDTHPKLAEDAEELVANIRRIRGSFTTFNVLFADREDYFSGKD